MAIRGVLGEPLCAPALCVQPRLKCVPWQRLPVFQGVSKGCTLCTCNVVWSICYHTPVKVHTPVNHQDRPTQHLSDATAAAVRPHLLSPTRPAASLAARQVVAQEASWYPTKAAGRRVRDVGARHNLGKRREGAVRLHTTKREFCTMDPFSAVRSERYGLVMPINML